MFKFGGSKKSETTNEAAPQPNTNQQQLQLPQTIAAATAATSQPLKPKEKGMFEFRSGYPRLQMALRIYCTVAALGMAMTGSYSMSGTHSCKSGYFYLVSAWLILLGVISVLVEWRQKHVRNLFAFLSYRTGRGLFYLFVGSLTTGISDVFGLVIGVAVILAGILTLCMTIFLRRHKNKMGKQQSLASQDQLQTQQNV